MKPILFNTEMVRAILEGRKTVTRRVCKPGTVIAIEHEQPIGGQPFYKGDILYVRETWTAYSRAYGEQPRIIYKADGDPPKKVKWHPSIHMPRKAARLFLRVTDVRVERLQEITDDEAKAEGANFGVGFADKMKKTAIERFTQLWDSTIKKADLDRYGWEANPWVWVIGLERCEEPEEDAQC